MAPGLAAKHPEIKTYSGRGLDDPTATIHADLSPLGFHASVRSAAGAWYIDPYYRLDQSVYASYYGRDVQPRRRSATPFVERDADGGRALGRPRLLPRGRHRDPLRQRLRPERRGHAHDLRSGGALRDAHADREADGSAPSRRASSPTRTAISSTHIVEATDGDAPASASYQVVARRPPDRRPADRRRPPHLPARADHRPGLRGLPRRLGERHRGEGRADEPRQPGLRGRPVDHAPADREQRPAQPRHVGRGDRAERALRHRRLLHAVAGHRAARARPARAS